MNIMVTLKKIKRINNIVSAEYYPEGDSSDIGIIKYDIDNKNVISVEYCSKDMESHLKGYSKKAVIAIEKLGEKNEFPEIYNYMWY